MSNYMRIFNVGFLVGVTVKPANEGKLMCGQS
jgi:hypothetical protein